MALSDPDRDPADALITAAEVSKTFEGGVTALQGIDLDVRRGDFVSIVGPSGCGKSTLLRLVAGLEDPTAGRLHLAGEPPARTRRRLGTSFVFQDATLLPWRTVRQNIALPLQLGTESLPRPPLPLDDALEMVGLSDFAGAFPRQLSGGMRMRVSIARALMTRPGLLLMDEPFGALDEMTRQRLNEELLRLWNADGWTCLFVTHNVSEAVFLSQRVLVMSHRPGRLLADFDIPLDPDRPASMRTAPQFNRLVAEISDSLRQEGLA